MGLLTFFEDLFVVFRRRPTHDRSFEIMETLQKILGNQEENMATLKEFFAAQDKSAKAILAFIASETAEILAQLEAGKTASGDAAASAAFDAAIESLGGFTATVGDAIQGMVPSLKTPEVVSEPVTVQEPAAPVVELPVPSAPVEVPVVISETSTGVEGAMSLEVK